MPLRSKEWFYKQCLLEVKQHGRFCHLCWDILEKGVGQKESTRGHVTQAIGACQEFLAGNRELIKVRKANDPTLPLIVSNNEPVRRAFTRWLAGHSGPFGRASFGYNYDTLKNILTPQLGGTRHGGGGGDDELKRVLRLMVEFL